MHKVTDLFKRTDLNIAFPTRNTAYHQLCGRPPQNKTKQTPVEYIDYNAKHVTCHTLARLEDQ